MPQIRPITDLRNTNEISILCHEKNEPVFITKNGYGDLVVMSIDAYERLASINEIDNSILKAESQYKSDGISYDAKTVFAELRRKHLGRV